MISPAYVRHLGLVGFACSSATMAAATSCAPRMPPNSVDTSPAVSVAPLATPPARTVANHHPTEVPAAGKAPRSTNATSSSAPTATFGPAPKAATRAASQCSQVTSPGNGLTPCAIAAVVNAHYGYFRACFEQDSHSKKAVITIAWGMDPSGRVVNAHVAGSTFVEPGFVECVRSGVGYLRFPPADKATGASWTFAFRRK